MKKNEFKNMKNVKNNIAPKLKGYLDIVGKKQSWKWIDINFKSDIKIKSESIEFLKDSKKVTFLNFGTLIKSLYFCAPNLI